MKNFAKILLTLWLGGLVLLPANLALAYTGVYGIFPAIVGGPEHVTVENFDFETNEENNYTDTIVMGLSYVYSMTIVTDGPIHQNILIKEYPSGSDQTFDVIVPLPVQNALVSATISIWAPDTESLVVRHEHQGEPTTFESAVKVVPTQQDENGNILWAFTVDSFSSFTVMKSAQDALRQSNRWSVSTMASLTMLMITSLVAPLALRRN